MNSLSAVRKLLRETVLATSRAEGWTKEKERAELQRAYADAPFLLEVFTRLIQNRKNN